MDAWQLLYHIAWPSGGTLSTITTSMGAKLLPCNALPTQQLCLTATAMCRLRIMGGNDLLSVCRCAGTYNLTLTSSLPNREVIMRSKANNILLSRVPCTCTLGANILMVVMIDAVRDGNKVIGFLSDDTYVFVILIVWVRKLSIKGLVQMEKWDGTVLHINNIVAALGD